MNVFWMTTAADSMKEMQHMAMPAGQNPMGQQPDLTKMFQSEKEFLDLAVHDWSLDNVEERVLKKYFTLAGDRESKKLQ
jgi:hypothetical protein